MAIREVKSEWSPEQLDYVKSFLCHYESDVAELPECCVGSSAKVSETNNEYVVSSSGKWVTRGKAMEEGGMPTTDDLVSAVIAALPVYGGETE